MAPTSRITAVAALSPNMVTALTEDMEKYGVEPFSEVKTAKITPRYSGAKRAQQYVMTCFHLLKGYFGRLKARPLAPGEGLGPLTWMPRKRCCSLDSSLQRRSGAGGSSCCVLDCQHSNEGRFKSGTKSCG